MSIDLAVNPRGIAVTANAAKRIISVMAQEPPGSMLRVSVAGGGCSGFQYIFDVDREKAPDDLVIERDQRDIAVGDCAAEPVAGGARVGPQPRPVIVVEHHPGPAGAQAGGDRQQSLACRLGQDRQTDLPQQIAGACRGHAERLGGSGNLGWSGDNPS